MEKQRKKRRTRIIKPITYDEIRKAVEEIWGIGDPIGTMRCIECVESGDCWTCDFCATCTVPFDCCEDEWSDDEHIYERRIEGDWKQTFKELKELAELQRLKHK